MMNHEGSRTDLGVVRIHNNVVASIASLAAAEIDGVKRVGGSFKSAVSELIGKKSAGAIRVEIDKHGEVRVDISVIIKYDFNIPDVAGRVQENVRQALEKMTNLSIKDINVNVQAIERG